ncbi:MAG TPA: sialidase family protein [Pyrinomonadaceae bacterium]|nr:sialidase family protein [Pyrinomonadaceae bacterium]
MARDRSCGFRSAAMPLIFSFILLACAAPRPAAAQVRQLPSPAPEQSAQPNLAVGRDGRVYLSWVERLPEKRFALRFSTKEGARWSAPRTAAEGQDWFVNWADFPTLAALPDGSLAAHWLVRSGPAVYAHDVKVSRSTDGGRTWSEPVTPHGDGTPTEHGFVSMFPAAGGALAAVWLDGRGIKGGHHGNHGRDNMTLRFTAFGRDGRPRPDALLDERVCECCQTSAAVTSEGPVVVYRDRSAEEIRDISIVRLRGGRWSAPATVHQDGWKLDGCPVNGPAVAAEGRRVVVAWYTGAGERFRVQAAFSEDAGESFGPPVRVDDGEPTGRVGVVALKDGSAVVSWMEKTAGGVEVRLRRVRPGGKRGESVSVAATAEARASGYPRVVKAKDSVVVAWVGGTRVLTAEMPLR